MPEVYFLHQEIKELPMVKYLLILMSINVISLHSMQSIFSDEPQENASPIIVTQVQEEQPHGAACLLSRQLFHAVNQIDYYNDNKLRKKHPQALNHHQNTPPSSLVGLHDPEKIKRLKAIFNNSDPKITIPQFLEEIRQELMLDSVAKTLYEEVRKENDELKQKIRDQNATINSLQKSLRKVNQPLPRNREPAFKNKAEKEITRLTRERDQYKTQYTQLSHSYYKKLTIFSITIGLVGWLGYKTGYHFGKK